MKPRLAREERSEPSTVNGKEKKWCENDVKQKERNKTREIAILD